MMSSWLGVFLFASTQFAVVSLLCTLRESTLFFLMQISNPRLDWSLLASTLLEQWGCEFHSTGLVTAPVEEASKLFCIRKIFLLCILS